MLVTATALLNANKKPCETDVIEAIGGVLCRCTGYRKIVRAVLDARKVAPEAVWPATGTAVGARITRLDGMPKADGSEIFGADRSPPGALIVRVVRSPYHHARFELGDLSAYITEHPSIVRIFTAEDVIGENCYGAIPAFADQPVFAESETRFCGEAIAAVVGHTGIDALTLDDFPVVWEELPALITTAASLQLDADLVHSNRAENILVRGRVVTGDVDPAMAEADVIAEGWFETGFVEHAYIEPEAGFARRIGDRIEVHVCTQAPYLIRDDIAKILGIEPDRVRIVPTAVGGGFGGKIDLSVQPFIALAAWHLNAPVRMVYSRSESIITTTKRHPAKIWARAGASRDGKIVGLDFYGEFNTGAYASWGPTVAGRVPVHASGPYFVPNYRALTQAVHTHLVPAGAFRGFGVPQASIAQEQLYDELADKLGLDRLEFRFLNALDGAQPTVTGQVLGAGVGIRQCLEALRPHWARARHEAETANLANIRDNGSSLRGVGVAGMWYGCGNTALPNPSTIRLGLKPDGRLALHQGGVDIGQGSNTVITQICADALGAPPANFDLVSADTDLTPDCGKTSASRQTFITGKAAESAGRALRANILRLTNAGEGARLSFGMGYVMVEENSVECRIDLSNLPLDHQVYALAVEETFDPPTSPLDDEGQGDPYAAYGFGAQMVELSVDRDLGTVRLLKITAAHDVGKAINPTLVEAQIEGGIAQGIGFALAEEFHAGLSVSLRDCLIPTAGDVPPIEPILIEDATPLGPFGAKGIGEQALIPTAPAILNAIYDAIGTRLNRVPATPERVRAAILRRHHV
jgi:CO/xanthine dehydrogenase Mo-binding subunit